MTDEVFNLLVAIDKMNAKAADSKVDWALYFGTPKGEKAKRRYFRQDRAARRLVWALVSRAN